MPTRDEVEAQRALIRCAAALEVIGQRLDSIAQALTDPEYVTTGVAGHMLGVSESVVRSMLDRHQLVGYRTCGGHRRILKSSVVAVRDSDAASAHVESAAR